MCADHYSGAWSQIRIGLGMEAKLSRISSRPGRTGGVTAFERKLLPRFSHWLFDQVDLRRPDFIIPAETKGARLLDAALEYMRDEHGITLDPPVIYRTALPYLSPEDRVGSRVMVIEDAIQTGTNLARHRERIKEYGIREIDAIVCVGHRESEGLEQVDAYLNVDDAVYTEYVWQLTDLIVARGLPPEIDHNVFELRFPVRFARAWRRLESMLSEYGTLTVDGPVSRSDEILPLTLHFPSFPDSGGTVTPVHHDGAEKLRLFPDPGADRAFIVPVSFPSVDFAAEDQTRDLSAEDATDAIAQAVGDRGVGALTRLLLSEAKVRKPRTVFRALSSCMEVDLVTGLARVLKDIFPAGIEIEAQPALFKRLYGHSVGQAVISQAGEQIAEAMRGCEGRAAHEPPDPMLRRPMIFLEPKIAEVTGEIAERLGRLHAKAEEAPNHNPRQRIGQSMPAIEADMPPKLRAERHLLISRCIDYGLATTALVPYVESEPDPGGRIRVERRYRVSEMRRRRTPVSHATGVDTDLKAIDRSAEALALICSHVSLRGGGANGAIGVEKLIWLTAILGRMVLAEHAIKLEVVPGSDGPRISLLDRVAPVPIDSVESRFFVIERGEDGIVIRATDHFAELYQDECLALDVDGATSAIEDSLDPLIALMSGEEVSEEELGALMAATSMSIDRRLGLTHVRHSIQEALRRLEEPLQLILRGEKYSSSPGFAEGAKGSAKQALKKLERLECDWSGPLKGRWENPSRSEQRLRLLLTAPSERAGMYRFAREVTQVIDPLAHLVECLDLAAASSWEDEEPDDTLKAIHSEILKACAGLETNLMSMREPSDPSPLPEQLKEANAVVARALLGVVRRLDAFAAAFAGDYRGETEPDLPKREERTVSALFFDLAGSGYRGRVDDVRSAQSWNDEGLNIAAQWTGAFAGREGGERKGDQIWVQFRERGDAAILCGALVQCHVVALRSSGQQDLSWRFHAGADSGTIRPGDVGNMKGACLDRAAKIAKACDEEADTDFLYVTEDLIAECSPALCGESIVSNGDRVPIDAGEDEGAQIVPKMVDSAATLEAYGSRLAEFVQSLNERVDALPRVEAQVEIAIEPTVEPGAALSEG
jgi:hypothetical protein